MSGAYLFSSVSFVVMFMKSSSMQPIGQTEFGLYTITVTYA